MRVEMKTRLLLLAAFAMVIVTTQFEVRAQQPDQPPGAPQRPVSEDPITRLNLTPEQWLQIRAIRQELHTAAVNQQFREANRALKQALDSENPDEAVIEQRLQQLSVAQAAQTRVRVLTELRIRRQVLTPAQVMLLRELQDAAVRQRWRQRLQNPRRQNLPGVNRRPQNERNTLRGRP
jgi:Spy/CpxP family protein refolding chaperone